MDLYGSNELVKVGCGDCKGCHTCCQGMGESILLDPYDFYQLQLATGLGFASLMQKKIALTMEQGIILPHLKMQEQTDACAFLNTEGRCSIHAHRPGLCRLFPLGRKFDEQGLRYFLLENACQIKNKTKVKVKKWLEIPALSQYEEFLISWHDLRKELMAFVKRNGVTDEQIKRVNLTFLEVFFSQPYALEEDFYTQYAKRKNLYREKLG